ncbi:ribonuclease H-like domain-containing protein [Tanacetum coccineum]
MVPRTVLTRSGPISVNVVRLVNTVQSRTTVNNVGPMKNVINNAYSTARRSFNKITITNNSNFTKKVNTVKGTRVNTARPKAVISAVKRNKGNIVKASTCWVWRPKHKVLDHGNPQQDLKDKGVIDNGCSRHMIGNKSYLTDYEEIDGGFVTFGGNSKGGKITRKGKIRTSKLDFEDVYFVKELKFNLFSVSQMHDKKNSVLFTDTECVVLSPDFRLTDESNLLLKVPRKDNMYSVALKNVIPQRGLTCLFVKSTPDESNLWHRRLGHVNFKTMNKLVRGNLVTGRKPALSFMRPFGCPVTILNTIDHLGKFDGKAYEGFFVGYSTNSKAFRVFNSRTRIVEENLHVQFSQNRPNIAGSIPNWLFDIDALTKSMNYKPVVAGNQTNSNAGTKTCDDAVKARMQIVPGKDYILLPIWPADSLFSQDSKSSPDAGFKPSREEEKKDANLGNEIGNPTKGKDSEAPSTEEPRINQEKDYNINNTNNINTASDGNITNNINAVSSTVNVAGLEVNVVDLKRSIELLNDPNMPELEDIVYSDDAKDICAKADMNNLDTFMPVSPIPTTRIHKDHPIEQIIGDLNLAPQTRRMIKSVTEHAMFKPKKVIQALKDLSWIEAMQEELLQFKLQQVWTLMDLPNGKRAIDTKWVYRNKKDERAIRLFLAYASFKDFVVYQMDVKSAFLYGKIEEEVYVCQPLGFEDPDFHDRVYKVEKALYRLHQAPRACSMGELTFFLGLQVKQKEDGIFISQEKYVTDILKKFGFSDVKTASTPMETHKPLLKDADGEDVDEHLYRSMIGSLMYLTSLRPDIMFVDSPFDLVAYTDSDYAGASLDRKSTIGAEYIVASNCCGQVLWIQNQLLDYGYNFMQTKIHIDNESTIFIVKNPAFHSKTKHIEIMHHFIRDSYEKKLIQMIKIHTNQNVADLLTKAFDVSRFQYLIARIRVNAGNSKLMLLGINLLLLEKVNAARHNLLLLVFWDTVKAKTVNGKLQLQALVDKKKVIITESTIRRDLQLEDVEEPMADKTENLESIPTHSNDLLLSGEDSLKLNELMELCTNLQKKVGLGAKVISSDDEANLGDQKDVSKQGRKNLDIDADEDITLDSIHVDTDLDMFGVHNLHDDEVFVEIEEPVVNAATTTTTTDESQGAGYKKQIRDMMHMLMMQLSGPILTEVPMAESKSIEFKSSGLLQVDVNNGLVKTCLAHHLPMGREFAPAILHHRICTMHLRNRPCLYSTTKVESEPPNGSNADIPNQCESEQTLNVSACTLLSTVQASVVNVKWRLLKITLQAPFLNVQKMLIAADQASVFMVMTPVHISSGLVLHQMTSDHNRSELRIQDHSNEQSSSKLVPKVVKGQGLKDKGKEKIIESKKPLKKKDQIMYDQEVALNLQAQLQAELEEEERISRQKEKEANIALIESWDNIQAMMDADYQMAQQLKAKEQEQLSIEEKSKLFVQLVEARKKHFAEMKAREKRKKPPTQA